MRIEPQDIPVEQRHLTDQAVGITINDVYALQRSAPLVKHGLAGDARCGVTHVTPTARRSALDYFVGVWPDALEMNEHVIEHGRMFNEIDDENAAERLRHRHRTCAMNCLARRKKSGREIIPVGETIYINGVPFTIIGMFQHYESEQDRKERELRKEQAASEKTAGAARSRGWGGRGARRAVSSSAQERHRLHSAEHDVDEISLRSAAAAPTRSRPASFAC